MIIIQTPLRISLFGGGTDFRPYFLSEGGCVLSSAIDKYIFVTIKHRFDDLIRVGYTKTEMVDRLDAVKHELIREAFKMTGITRGVEITTMSDIPSEGSGLGSSGTVTVGSLHAMYALNRCLVTGDRLARQACEIEIDVLEKPVGVQDQYIAAFGGFRFMEFHRDGEITSRLINISEAQKRQLNGSLMLFYTGLTRKSSTILTEQKSNINKKKAVLGRMKGIALEVLGELERGNLDSVGDCLHESWRLKKQLASGISNGTIDAMYEKARSAGAIGGKTTGAGGGGFLLLYCPAEKQGSVRHALKDFQELHFNFEDNGSKVIFNYQR